MTSVDEAVGMWEVFRAGMITELENIPEEQWDYRPGDGARTVRELAMHVAASAEGFAGELVAAETSFRRLRDPEVQQRLTAALAGVRSKAEVIEFLKTSMAGIAARLRGASETLAQQTMPSFKGEQSRVSGIWFAAAHEMYHRGQLTAYARSLGIVPAMTRGTQAPPKP